MVRALKLLLVAPVAALLLGGCGSSGTGDVTTAPAADATRAAAPDLTAATDPPLPACASVWIVDRALPDTYLGCRSHGAPDVRGLRCENGQELFTHAGRFFAVPGGRIFEASAALADDNRFQQMHRVCTA